MALECGPGTESAAEPPEFEEIYACAGADFGAVPWAMLAAHPVLVDWLDEHSPATGRSGLVVGCGLGDDAEELADRGYRVSAFDLSHTAIDWCRRRFPASTVKYQVADLFCLPASLRAQFDLTVEINTLQSLPPQQRTAAMAAIAQTVRPGGRAFVRCLARDDDEAVGSRPWPVSRAELQGFRTAGLHELEVRDDIPGRTGSRCFRAIYQRPPQEAMDRSELVTFIRKRGLAVVATRGPDGAPQAALVGVAATDQAEIIFDTSASSRKYRNIQANPDVALVVGWDDEVTVQCEGRADILTGVERSRCLRAYFDQYPDGRQRAQDPDIVHVRIRPHWVRYSDYRPDSFANHERRLDETADSGE